MGQEAPDRSSRNAKCCAVAVSAILLTTIWVGLNRPVIQLGWSTQMSRSEGLAIDSKGIVAMLKQESLAISTDFLQFVHSTAHALGKKLGPWVSQAMKRPASGCTGSSGPPAGTCMLQYYGHACICQCTLTYARHPVAICTCMIINARAYGASHDYASRFWCAGDPLARTMAQAWSHASSLPNPPAPASGSALTSSLAAAAANPSTAVSGTSISLL